MDFLNLLHQLCDVHAVAGYEDSIHNAIITIAKQNSLPYHYKPWYGVVIWNHEASHYCIAHTDEVGAKITHVAPTIRFDGIGWVNPGLFVGREVEIATNQWIVYGLVVWKEALQTVCERSDLQIIVDPNDESKIFVWDPIRYKSSWHMFGDSLLATSLDNRLWCAQLLYYILNHKNKEDLLAATAFCFCGDEEVRNKGAVYFVKTYKPKSIAIFDMIPHHFVSSDHMDNVIIQKQTSDFVLDETMRWIVQDTNCYFLDTQESHLIDSEAKKYKDITHQSTINIYTPMYNYHHGTYMVSLSLLNKANTYISDFLNKFSLLS
jgi:putative aminopeptidase FrvX